MKIAGVVCRPFIPLYGAGVDTQFSNSSSCGLLVGGGKRFSGELGQSINGGSRVSLRPRKFFEFSSSRYSDSGHLEYYVSPKSKEKKEKSSEINTVKKKLKLIKRLSRDFSMFSDMASGVETESTLMDEVEGKKISEAREVLLAQLQQLRSEQKELKRRNKEKKAQLQAGLMRTNKARCKSESSSSSSSESSDSECGEVIDMGRMRSSAMKQSLKDDDEPLQAIQEATLLKRSSLIQQKQSKELLGINGEFSLQNFTEGSCNITESGDRCSSSKSCSTAVAVGASISVQRIEVCMGGKCKKVGAPAILEKLKSKIGVEGAVGGCKCMGKCRDGPNVRVLNDLDGIQADGAEGSVKSRAFPLCIGVGLEDVGVIVANFLGEDGNHERLMAPA